MKNLAVLTLVAFSLGWAQTQPDVQLPSNVRMYKPKNLTPNRAQQVALFVQNLIGVPVAWNDVPNAFVIRNAKPADMDLAEALLKRYDVAETNPNIELIVYLIRAATAPQPPADARFPAPAPQNPVPADLKAAIDEMKGTLNYDHYTLWDTIFLQLKGNGPEVQGILPWQPGDNNYVYTVGYGVYGGAPTEGKTVNLASFMFSIKTPQGKEEVESHIRTDVSIREGQKLVLGKIHLLPNAHADLFLVLTTKVN